jgi:predicted metal-binding membrane protein
LAFGAAYLGAWAAAGLVPLMVLSWWRPVNAAAWIDRVGGAAVVTAGLYQASPWKLSHLRVCRDPVAVGRTPREGVIAGLSYARCCLGCCWALMTVLFVIGLMDLAWMVAVSAALLVERNWRDGPRLARLVGLATVGLGLAVLVHPSVLTTVASVHHPTMMSAPVPQWA